jgi:hypothetical protein
VGSVRPRRTSGFAQRAVLRLGGWFSLAASGLLGACGNPTATNPFAALPDETSKRDAGVTLNTEPSEGLIDDDVGPSGTIDPSLGGRCLDDEQCDDELECTFDRCDLELGRCRFVADDSLCQDGLYCNGVEVCSLTRGCRPGQVVSCDDTSACTLNRCVEATESCETAPRDADGDGDIDARCSEEGSDCNDEDPTVSGLFPEICGNGRDDDCDQTSDEPDCETPAYDVCEAALELDASASFLLSAFASGAHSASRCSEPDARDLFVDLVVEEEGANVELTLSAPGGQLALAAFEQCGVADSEQGCDASSEGPEGLSVARLRLHQLAPGHHSVALFAAGVDDLELNVDFQPSSAAPSNETCGSALDTLPGEPFDVDLLGAVADVESQCATGEGDRVYRFHLAEPSDVRVFGTALDLYGAPIFSLRGADCVADERTCTAGDGAELFARGLAAGEYHLVVSSTVPTKLSVLLQTSAVTPAPSGEDCAEPPELPHNMPRDVALSDFADDVDLGCLASGRDATLRLTLQEVSDVLLTARVSARDTAAIGLAPAGECDQRQALGCSAGETSPLRLVEHRLLPGDYDVVVESKLGAAVQVMAWVRKATPPTLATHSENCEAALSIPPSGGAFQGNTSAAFAEYSANCDSAGLTEFGAADQLLRLELAETRRVFFDMAGSSFQTLLNLREGAECPGTGLACVASVEAARSSLDIVLREGQYFVQVDGFVGSEGQWFLEVFSAEP